MKRKIVVSLTAQFVGSYWTRSPFDENSNNQSDSYRYKASYVGLYGDMKGTTVGATSTCIRSAITISF